LRALELLSRDSGKSIQQLADEAFADLLAKHDQPRTLKDALMQSARRAPANEKQTAEAAWLLISAVPFALNRQGHGLRR